MLFSLKKIYFKIVLVLSCLPHLKNSFLRAQPTVLQDDVLRCEKCKQLYSYRDLRSGSKEVRFGLCPLGDFQVSAVSLEALLLEEVFDLREIIWVKQMVLPECGGALER